MGKGDKKTRKGKIFMGTYGNTRPRKSSVAIVIPKKKKAATKTEKVKKKVTTKKQLKSKN